MIPLWIRKLLKIKQTTAEIIELIKDLKVGEQLNIYCCDWKRTYRSGNNPSAPLRYRPCYTIESLRSRISGVYGAGMFTTTHVNKKAAITRISEERQTR